MEQEIAQDEATVAPGRWLLRLWRAIRATTTPATPALDREKALAAHAAGQVAGAIHDARRREGLEP